MKTRTNQPITDTPIEYNDKTKTVEVGTNLEVDGIVKGNGLGLNLQVVKRYDITTAVTYTYENFFDSGDGVYVISNKDAPNTTVTSIELTSENHKMSYIVYSPALTDRDYLSDCVFNISYDDFGEPQYVDFKGGSSNLIYIIKLGDLIIICVYTVF